MRIPQTLALITLLFCCARQVTALAPSYYKCCAKGERLDSKVEKCERIPGIRVKNVIDEDIRPSDDRNLSLWLPQSRLSQEVPVVYNTGPLHRWNVLVNADDTASWTMRGEAENTEVWVKSEDGAVRGFTKKFCFDAAAFGSPYPRVLLALVTNITKCCRKEEFFSAKESQCVPGNGVPQGEDPDFENIYLSNDTASTLSWLPPQLHASNTTLVVRYGGLWHGPAYLRSMYRAEGGYKWHVEYRQDVRPSMDMTLPLSPGRWHVERTQDFCYETVSDLPHQPRVIIAVFHTLVASTFHKCCFFGGRLGPHGYCEEDPDSEWSSLTGQHTVKDEKPILLETFKLAFCRSYFYQVDKDLPREIPLVLSETYNREFERFMVKSYCFDGQRTTNGSQRDVIAFCAWPPSASLFEVVRPLHVVAAALLAAGVAAILSREDMRRNTHGLALAVHAACLVAANGLQAMWFFTSNIRENCDYYAYSIYFFLMAGAFWLNAMAGNMAYGFMQPLGVLARGGDRSYRRRFVVLSVYAWGAAVALTAFAIYMDRDKIEMERRGYVTPSFLETRTCRIEGSSFLFVQDTTIEYQSKDRLGSLHYYYVPSALLVAGNSVFLTLTLWKISELKKDSSYLEKTSPCLCSALIYVKLLLSAGFLELALEGIAWGVRHQIYYRGRYWTNTDVDLSNHYLQTGYIFASIATLVDVLRAAAVLWLCVGRWDWVGSAWRRLRERLPWPKDSRPEPPLVLEETTNSSAQTSKDEEKKSEQ